MLPKGPKEVLKFSFIGRALMLLLSTMTSCRSLSSCLLWIPIFGLLRVVRLYCFLVEFPLFFVLWFSLLFYILSAITERHRIEEGAARNFSGQSRVELLPYFVWENSRRPRTGVLPEIHIGPCPDRNSAGIDAVKVLSLILMNRAGSSSIMSQSSFEMVSVIAARSVRCDNTLKEALIKIIVSMKPSPTEIHPPLHR